MNNLNLNELPKNELVSLLTNAYRYLSDEQTAKEQLAKIKRRIHQTLQAPVGFQGILRWALPVAVFIVTMGVLYSILGSFISFVAAAVATYFTYGYSTGKKDKALSKEKVAQYRRLESEAQSELVAYQESLEFSDSMRFLPVECQNIYAVAALYNILLTGRADNWKEAINKYDIEKHAATVESNQMAMIKNQEAQISAAKSNNILLENVKTDIAIQTGVIAEQMRQIDNISRNTADINNNITNIKNRM
ncbi:hypothetical protein [Leuconostoc citreum]|uniref:hypothetical protein n=1 Tax=Leuconostoc citreum TaxID=33964 RepID=UPI003B428260